MTAHGAFFASSVAGMSPKLVLIVTSTGPSATGVDGGFWTFFAGCWPLSRYWHAPLSAEGDAFAVVPLVSVVPLSPQPEATSARTGEQDSEVLRACGHGVEA